MKAASAQAEGAVRFLTVAGSRIAYRAWGEGPGDLLCLHGFPTSSFLWRRVAPAIAAFRRVIAPDLPGFGDSDLGDRAGTWEEMIAFLEEFTVALGLGSVDLMVHDWGGLIGLRWACDHPRRVASLIITDTGFFPDGKWHSLAQTMRQPGAGEAFMESLSTASFATTLRAVSPALPDEAITEYWKCLATDKRRRAKLALYRSGDFTKLQAYDGKLAALGCPTLLIWGGEDRFAPPAGARRLSREIAGAELHVLAGVNHFLQEEAPKAVASLAANFLRARPAAKVSH